MDNKCTICHKKNDQLLMLSCGHDPCIECATTHYFSGSQYRKQFKTLKQANYWCQLCYEPTIIDRSSIQELNLYYSRKNMNAKGHGHAHGHTYTNVKSQPNFMLQTLKRSKSQRIRNISKNQGVDYEHGELYLNGPISSRNANHINTKTNTNNKQKHRSKQRHRQKQSYRQRFQQQKQYQLQNRQLENLLQLASSHQLKGTKLSNMEQINGRDKGKDRDHAKRSNIKGVKSSTNLLTSTKSKSKIKPSNHNTNHIININSNNTNNLSKPCPTHQDEPLQYYCFSCLKTICVECALHGQHIGHTVQSIRKSSKKLKQIYENILAQSQKYRNNLQQNIQQFDRYIQKYKEWNGKHIELLEYKFKELYRILKERQSKILGEIKAIEKEGLDKIGGYKKMYQDMLDDIKDSSRVLKKAINVQVGLWDIGQLENKKDMLSGLVNTCHQQGFGTGIFNININTNMNIINNSYTFNNGSGTNNTNINNLKKLDNEVKYIQTQLIIQAIDTILELVTTFKTQVKNQSISNQVKYKQKDKDKDKDRELNLIID